MTAEQRHRARLANVMRDRDLQLIDALDALRATEAQLELAQARIAELEQAQPKKRVPKKTKTRPARG